jgi:hypothetical protein
MVPIKTRTVLLGFHGEPLTDTRIIPRDTALKATVEKVELFVDEDDEQHLIQYVRLLEM